MSIERMPSEATGFDVALTEAEVEIDRLFGKNEDSEIRERAGMAFDYAATASRVLHELWEFDNEQALYGMPDAVAVRRKQFYVKAWACLRASRRAGVEAEDLLASRLDHEVS